MPYACAKYHIFLIYIVVHCRSNCINIHTAPHARKLVVCIRVVYESSGTLQDLAPALLTDQTTTSMAT